jgi:hypothetical protein
VKKIIISIFLIIIIVLTPAYLSVETQFIEKNEIKYYYYNSFKIKLDNDTIKQIYNIASKIENNIYKNKSLLFIDQILTDKNELLINQFFYILHNDDITNLYDIQDSSDMLDELYDFIFQLIVERLGWINDLFDKTNDIINDAIDLWNDKNIPREIRVEIKKIIDKINDLEKLLTLLTEGKYVRFLRQWSPLIFINEIKAIVDSITIIAYDIDVLVGDIRNFIDSVSDFVNWFNDDPWKDDIYVYGRVMKDVFNGASNVTIRCMNFTTKTDEDGNFSLYVTISPSDFSIPSNKYYGIHKCVISAESGDTIKTSFDNLSYVFSGGSIYWLFHLNNYDDTVKNYRINNKIQCYLNLFPFIKNIKG